MRQPHAYQRAGTAQRLTVVPPRAGHVRVKGVPSPANALLHPWLKAELSTMLATRPERPHDPLAAANRAAWRVGQAGVTQPQTVPAERPRWRRRLIWDTLAGHATHDLVLGLVRHGIMPL